MKIAMMTNNYKPFVGGVPISVERLKNSLQEMGHEVTVFAPTYENMEAEKDVLRYSVMLSGVWGGVVIPNGFDPAIEEAFQKGNFDVIHVHHPMVIGWTAVYLSKKYHVPLTFTYHTRYEQYLHYLGLSGLKKMVPAYVRAFASQCDCVIAPTPEMKEYLEEIAVSAPVSVLPTGLEEDSFYPEKDKVSKLRRALLGEKKYLFVTVARLAKEKNIGFLLESLALRKKQGKDDFVLALAGDGPERTSLAEEAKKLGIGDSVVFAGNVPNCEVKNYCAAADLFLFASTTETQGIVSLEAMAAGTPVLAVYATGTKDIVSDGVNGYMTEESVTVFTQRLNDLLQDGQAGRLRDGAKKTAENYDEKAVAVRALSCYSASIYQNWEKQQIRRVKAVW